MAVHSTAKRKGSADKRDRILRAAIKVFAKNGFYATRVSEIAKAAGVADGTIYLYFKNKDDVLITIFEDGIQQLLAILREVASSTLRVRSLAFSFEARPQGGPWLPSKFDIRADWKALGANLRRHNTYRYSQYRAR